MVIGVLKEIKQAEKRVSLLPSGAETLVAKGHTVYIEKDAGTACGFEDAEYVKAGASIHKRETIWEKAEMVLHVKEIMPSEFQFLKKNQIVFTYLHLAADREQTLALQESGCIAFAYETIESKTGQLPLLQPMSEVAGRMSVQEGARFLQTSQGGSGVLISGVPGVRPARVAIIGAGVVGTNAAKIAIGMGAEVVILDKNIDRLRYLDDVFGNTCRLLYSSPQVIQKELSEADLVIGAVLVPGAKAPKLVTADMLQTMKQGSVMVDVAIDQGGCFETSKPTSHADPVYVEQGIIHYCVTNMPGAVAKTSAQALTNASLPYVIEIADKGWEKAIDENEYLKKGLNVCKGEVVYKAVAEAHGLG